MDPKIREVLEAVMRTQEQSFKNLSESMQASMENLNETCYSKNSGNADRFAECIKEKAAKISDLSELFSMKQMFFARRIQACIVEQKKSVSDCTQEGSKIISDIIENTKK